MIFRVELTARAQRDLAAIYAFIHADSSEHAFQWFNGLERTILSLEKQPERGVPVSGHKGLRQLLYGKKPHRYRVLYSTRKKAGVVVVLHIRHGARTEDAEEARIRAPRACFRDEKT